DAAHPKSQKDASLDPQVYNPFVVDLFGRSDLSRVECVLESGKQGSMFVVEFSRRIVKEVLDVVCQIHARLVSWSIYVQGSGFRVPFSVHFLNPARMKSSAMFRLRNSELETLNPEL